MGGRYDLPGFTLDMRRRKLFPAGSTTPVALASKAFETLAYLIDHRARVVEKDELLQALWPRVIVEPNSLERQISALRRVFAESPGENRFIATVPGRGYQFVAAVAEQAEADAPAVPDGAAPRPGMLRNASLLAGRRGKIGALVALGFIVLAALPWWRNETLPVTPRATAGPPVAPAYASLAVMPFANHTGDPGKDYLGDGIAEELILLLSRRSGMRIPAKTSTFAYKGQGIDLRRVGEDLGVAWLLEGSIRGGEDRVRVAVQLIEARTGFHVWSQSYERPFTDVFALQDEIAGAVVQRLAPGLHSGGSSDVALAPPTRDTEAYRRFLQANALAGISAPKLRQALENYDQALARDPDFARALAARANTRLLLMLLGLADGDELSLVRQDVSRALELEPGLAAAHSTHSMLQALLGQWDAAERSIATARDLDPADPVILNNQAMLAANSGDFDAALRMSDEALGVAPLALPVLMQRSHLLSIAGRVDEAERFLDIGVSLGAPINVGGASLIRAEIELKAGRGAAAGRQILHVMQPDAVAAGAEAALVAIYEAHLDPPRRPAAAAALRALVSRVPVSSLDRRRGTLLMVLFALVDDLDSAYAWANAALDYYAGFGTVGYPWYSIWSPYLVRFRADPRFGKLVDRLHMTSYLQATGLPPDCRMQANAVTCG